MSDLLIQGVQLGVNHSKRRKKKRNETNQSKNVTVPDEDQDLEEVYKEILRNLDIFKLLKFCSLAEDWSYLIAWKFSST